MASLNQPVKRTTSKSNVNCCVYGCSSVNKKKPELSFHKFPPIGQKISQTDEFGTITVTDRRKSWEIALKMGKPVSSHMTVCSRHFKCEDYITPNDSSFAKRILNRSAVPSLNLPTVRSQKVAEFKLKIKEDRTRRLNERRKIKANLSNAVKNKGNDIELETLPVLINEIGEESNNQTESNFTNVDPSVYLIPKYVNVSTQTLNEETDFSSIKPCHQRCDATVQVQTKWVTILDFVESDKSLQILSGIPSFTLLKTLAELYLKCKKDKRGHRLSIMERIALVFFKLKLDLSFSALTVLFGNITVTTCKKFFEETTCILAEILKTVIIFPSKENIYQNMPICFKNFTNVRIVLDCTEIYLQASKKLCCRIKTYFSYKKRHTIKFMTGVSLAGLITFVSEPYGGRASDKAIFEQSGLINYLEPYIDQIMVDKGFLIDKICENYSIQLVRPPFLRKKKQFSREEALINSSIAKARVHIERVNARLKVFRILRNTFPLHLVSIIHEIFIIICGITNLSSPILKNKYFLSNS